MIELKDVHKIYDDKNGQSVHALKGVSFDFPETGLIFIVGESGSGKSTMMNLLGLLDDYDDGQLLIEGKESKGLTFQERDTYRALNIGFVFQEFHIIEKYTIGQNISLALEIGQKESTKEQIASALEKVGLSGFENRYAKGVSGGQKQRVAIARAIVKCPKIILADEPTGNLDSVTSREIFELLKELSKDNLIVVISHDIESSHRYADKIIELSDGLINDVYVGDKTTDTIRLSVDDIDETNKNEINELLKSGKKVVLVKKIPEKEIIETQEKKAVSTVNLETRVRLPLKSSLKLSMLSMRTKWLRVLFTVILSMCAVAFFGFADMVGQFSANNIMAQELENSGFPFTPIAVMQTEDENSLIPRQQRVPFENERVDEFRRLNLNYAVHYTFPLLKIPGFISYHTMFPTPTVYTFLAHANGVFEVPSPLNDNESNELGVYLTAGRWARNYYEIVVTNFMFERWLRYGIRVAPEGSDVFRYLFGSVPSPYYRAGISERLTSIDQILEYEMLEEIVINQYHAHIFSGRRYRIVGMVCFDVLEPFQSILPNEIQTTPVTSEQRRLIQQFSGLRDSHLNNYFVVPGFFENFVENNRYLGRFGGNYMFSAQMQILGQSTNHTVNAGLHEVRCIEDFVTRGLWGNVFRPDFDIERDIHNAGQIIITVDMLLELLPHDMSQLIVSMIQLAIMGGMNEVDAAFPVMTYFIHNHGLLDDMTISLSEGTQDRGVFSVIGIRPHFRAGNVFWPSDDFFDDAIEIRPSSVLVSASTHEERMHLLSVLSNYGRFTELDEFYEEQLFEFVVWSQNAREIHNVGNMFSLLVGIFSLATFLFLVFSVLLMYSFIAASINSRKKDIGILRSLGASQKDIAKIFITEGIIIAILMILFSGVLGFLGYYFLNMFFISELGYIAEAYTLISYGWRQILLMSALAVGGVAISIFLPIIRIARKQLVQVIRE
ncbi:MAG: ATP-binding cassette domain-containing protein [Firmicutes bacterium]|nr:ATP-binding cassette domain-containing protein [Bacillota bacterium]